MTNAQDSGPGAWTARRVLGLFGNILIWVIVAIDAWFLWPTSLGGQTSLVVVSGHSMEPTYFGGDLVIARTMEPEIGDVIVYAPEGYGGAQIVHRIIGGNGEDGWVVQGDNNAFIDPFEPTNDEVKGVVLVHYSNLGRITTLVMNPILWAGVLLAALVILIWNSGDDCDDDDDEDDETDDAETTLLEDAKDFVASAAAGFAALTDKARSAWASAQARRADATAARPASAVALPAPRAALRQGALALLCVSLLVSAATATPASASHLDVDAPNAPAYLDAAPCADTPWAATAGGTGSGGSYTQVALSGIPSSCQGKAATIALYSSAGALLASGTVTPGGATANLTVSSYVAANVSLVIVKVDGWVLRATWTAPVITAPASCVALNPAGNPTDQVCTPTVQQTLTTWGSPGARLGFISYKITTGGSNAILTLDLSKIGFGGWNYGFIQTNGDWIARPDYSCSELPIVRLYANPAHAGVGTNAYIWVQEQPSTPTGPLLNTWICPR